MLSDLKIRLRALFRRSDVEREMDDELRFHLDHEIAKHVAAGVPRAEAERMARLSFGGMDRIREDTRDARGVNVIENLLQDVRYAWRGIVSRPGFAGAIIIALALGIGANAAMFGIVDRLIFRPPAYLVSPDRVHRVYLTYHMPGDDRTERTTQYTRYADLTRWTSSFDKTAVVGYRSLPIGVGEDTRELPVVMASATLFDLFDARPVLGRFYSAAEDKTPVGDPVVVLGYSYWQSQYGGRRDVLGTQLHVGNAILTIIGVAPEGFTGITDDRAPALFIPVTTYAGARNQVYFKNYHWGWLEMFARRKPGVSIEHANADLTVAFHRSWDVEGTQDKQPTFEEARGSAMVGSVHLSRGPEASTDAKVGVWVMGVALIVLLVACANVANLLLARAVARRREIAMRVALGVSRGRLLQQLATESLMLAALGGIAGLIIAYWGGNALRVAFVPVSDASPIVTDLRTVLFTFVATMTVALLTGLVPALHSLRADVNSALKGGARDGGRRRSRTGTALLLFQGALSVVLLVGAGLFMRSLSNVRSMRLGYDFEPIAFIVANMRGANLKVEEQIALNQRLLEAAQSVPGVISATLTTSVPFNSNEGRGAPIVPGRDSLAKYGKWLMQAGSPSYFKTVGTRILRGRGIEPTDQANTEHVAVVTEKMAGILWPGENPVGKQFKFQGKNEPMITVVGVAEDMKARQIDANNEIWYYMPVTQIGGDSQYPQIFARVTGRPEDYANAFRKRLQPLLPGASYIKVTPLSRMVNASQRAWKVGATMFMAFGGLALLLSAIGLYSLIAYGVAQRTRELGVRIALGANSGRVMRMIVGQGAAFALAGIAIGSGIAWWAADRIEPLLFNEPAKDPVVFAVVGAVLLLVAIVASAKPAYRAMSVDPSEVLRSD